MANKSSTIQAVQPYKRLGPSLIAPPGYTSGTFPPAEAQFDFWAKPVLINPDDGTYFCPGFDGETYATNPWDYIKIITVYAAYAGQTLDKTPGICRLQVGKSYQVDTKKQLGANGARNTYYGEIPAGVKTDAKHGHPSQRVPFEIEITIWTPEQQRQLQNMWRFLCPPGSKGDPLPFDAYHPSFTTYGIKSMQFIGMTGPVLTADRRGTYTIHAVEFQLPDPPASKSAVKTATAALPNTFESTATATPAPGSNPSDLAPH